LPGNYTPRRNIKGHQRTKMSTMCTDVRANARDCKINVNKPCTW